MRTQLKTTGRFMTSLKKKNLIKKSYSYVIKEFKKLMLKFLCYTDEKLHKIYVVLSLNNAYTYLNLIKNIKPTKFVLNTLVDKLLLNYLMLCNIKLNIKNLNA